MQAAVIVANPVPGSFSHAAAQVAADGLRRAGYHVETVDLYASGFGAAMSPEERRAYHTDQPILSTQVADQVAIVQRSAVLVFVYPTWWSSLPAILKGWLERVMVPGVGFRFDQRGKVRPGLTHVRRIVGISTYGSPRTYVRLINDNGRRVLSRTLRLSCGWRTRCTWLAMYKMDGSSIEARQAFLNQIGQRMARL